MNNLLALVWLVIIGTNGAQVYSDEEWHYQGWTILAGALYFPFVYQTQFLRLLLFKDFHLVLLLLALPILLMLLSDRSFDRGEYTSQIGIVLIFVVASTIALRDDFDHALAIAAFVIVAIGTALNLYELFIENNVWSSAPGRSAGFYRNPNISGEALVGYGLIFMLARSGKLRIADLLVVAVALAGVIATFSRGGILAGPLLLAAAAGMRAQTEHMLGIVAGSIAVSLLSLEFFSYIFYNVELSEDASVRIFSLIDDLGVGDFMAERGELGMISFDLAMESPITGLGAGTISQMAQGPHNTFIAVLVESGMVGVVIYVASMIRLTLVALRAERAYAGRILLVVGWLIIFSFVSHTVLSNAPTIPLLGFAVARACQITSRAVRTNR